MNKIVQAMKRKWVAYIDLDLFHCVLLDNFLLQPGNLKVKKRLEAR